VEWRHDRGAGIAASAIVHLSVVALLILLAEVHPFGTAPTEPIAVELVTDAEADRKVEPTPTPTPVPQLPRSQNRRRRQPRRRLLRRSQHRDLRAHRRRSRHLKGRVKIPVLRRARRRPPRRRRRLATRRPNPT
jgi:hypothetical protein